MTLAELTDPDAVRRAAREYDELGQAAFLERHQFGTARRYYVQVDGRLYDAKAIAGVARNLQHPDREPLRHSDFNGGDAGANAALRRLRFTIVDGKRPTSDLEQRWRQALWRHLQQAASRDDGFVDPAMLAELGVHSGEEAIFSDPARSMQLDQNSAGTVAVSVTYTEAHRPGRLYESGVIYDYPEMQRPADHSADIAPDIDSVKATAEHKLPLFVVIRSTADSPDRRVRLGWVEGWDDLSKHFLITFGETPPDRIQTADHFDETPFVLLGNRTRRAIRAVRERPDQRKFAFDVFQRYGPQCALSGTKITQMLDAVHIVPDVDGGPSDPRNGLVMNASLHRAFDAHLFGIDPATLAIVTPSDRYTLTDLGIRTANLSELALPPHPDALRWRYEQYLAKHRSA